MKKSKFALNFITLGASAATLVVPLTSCAPTGKVIITIACDQHGQGSGIKEVNVGTKFGDIEPELRKYVSPYFSELFELTD
ncbi:MAG: hypothetical protein MJ233_04065 [Mycoplasmoidaceae bacterium]|nr:hypothetical protein [Mycoplasmoidaceae bacterium]